MKPTIKLALLRSPGHGARRWLQHLTQHQEKDCWRASLETETNLYDLTVGMPALGHPHVALVLLDVNEGVTALLRRSLWHARRRGITHWFALLHYTAHDQELFDAATIELREAFLALGLDGNALVVTTATEDPEALVAVRARLFSLLDEQVSLRGSLTLAQLPPEKVIKRLLFYDPESAELWRGALWAALSRGEEAPAPFDLLWRFYSILAQASGGYFDDVPDLVSVAEGPEVRHDEPYARLAFELMGHLGTWSLYPLIRAYRARREKAFYFPDELIFYALRHWNYPACVKELFALKALSTASGVRALIKDKIEQILGVKSWATEEAKAALDRYDRSHPTRTPLFQGQPFSLIEVARQDPNPKQGEDLSRNLSDLFRAQTGQLDNPRERYIFLENRAASFEPGKRYFNGHALFDGEDYLITEPAP